MRLAISSGCSIKFDFDSITPGMRILPAGSLTVSNRAHSWACRGFAASKERKLGRAEKTILKLLDDFLFRHAISRRLGNYRSALLAEPLASLAEYVGERAEIRGSR